ncbi:MAG TPA: GNAT family N-acetyltransferase [bacterium]|jgi:GNAT superfamily N-acetyltransferase
MSDTHIPRNHRLSDISGDPVRLRQCRIAVVSSDDLPHKQPFNGSLRKVDLENSGYKKAVRDINMFYWASLEQDVYGKTYKVMDLEHIVAIPENSVNGNINEIAGHVGFCIEKVGFLHIVVFHVWPLWTGAGVGKQLLEFTKQEAIDKNINTIKLGTTNDNLPALYFYQKNGFEIEDVISGEVTSSQGYEQKGFAGIPVRDEIHMKLTIRS